MVREKTLSVIVPIFNEEGNITALDAEIKAAVVGFANAGEIIYINDASTDGSAAELSSLINVTVITLNRRYGQASALDAGFAAATGDVVVSLDGDGQNDPADIAFLLEKMQEEKLDVVTGWRKIRKDSGGIRALTTIGRTFRKLIINDHVHDTGCTLRVYTNEAVKNLSLGGEMHRYILALLRWKGFTIGEVEVHDRPRLHGKSKYGYSKAVRGLIDLIYVWFIYKYSQRPLHLFGYFSFTSFALAILAAFATLYDFFILHTHLNHNGWFYLSFFMAISGILFFSFGIVIDMVLRIYMELPERRKSYIIRSIVKQ